MTPSFFEQPVLNSPYEAPRFHHALDEHGQPLDVPPVEGRRRSEIITPVPMPRMQTGRTRQGSLALGDLDDPSVGGQEYNPTPIINEIRNHVASWRALPNPADWGVTPTTARLLAHWRSHQFSGVQPFFCQIEAVETVIWLTEVAWRRPQYRTIRAHLEKGNAASNRELFRLAMKMATGAGKTTVMAMLIAWHTANAVRTSGSSRFSKGFLNHHAGDHHPRPAARSEARRPGQLLRLPRAGPARSPPRYRQGEDRHHELSRVSKARDHGGFQGRPRTAAGPWRSACRDRDRRHDAGARLRRTAALKNVVVINDEAHHCYRERPPRESEDAQRRREGRSGQEQRSGAALDFRHRILEAQNRAAAVYDLSATPFFSPGQAIGKARSFPGW